MVKYSKFFFCFAKTGKPGGNNGPGACIPAGTPLR